MRALRIIIQVVLLTAVLAVGVGITGYLMRTKREPPKRAYEYAGPLVNVARAQQGTVQMTVEGFGTVRARTVVQVIPEVAGKVVSLHPELLSGGSFTAGERLIQIDTRDYELAVQQAQASLARAQVKLEQEKAEAAVAKSEWELLNPGTQPNSVLVLREPQIREAQAELAAAQAELKKAQLDLERTTVSLPFDGRVVEKMIDIGQFVQPGSAVASVYGTEVMEIPVPLQQQALAWFDLPGTEGRQGAGAPVHYRFAGREYERPGRVVRSEAQVDQANRMVTMIVEVAEPFAGPAPSLVPGTFVTVEIIGRPVADVTAIPSYALRGGNEVWVVEESQLRIRPVTLVRRTKETVYIDSGLEPDSQIVLTSLEVVTDGMKVRTGNQQAELAESKRESPDIEKL